MANGTDATINQIQREIGIAQEKENDNNGNDDNGERVQSREEERV